MNTNLTPLQKIAIGLALVLTPAAASADVISGSSLAFGESVALTGALSLSSGPTPQTFGLAAPPYSPPATSSSAASASVGSVLTTGALTVNARSNVNGTAGPKFANADATVEELLALINALIGFSLGATSVQSTAEVSGDVNALVTSGSTTVENLVLTIGGDAFAFNGTVLPNTVISVGGSGVEVVLNEQIVGGDGINTSSLVVNAIHISFDDFLIGTALLDGDIIISHSEAALVAIPGQTVIPEPASLLLFGLGMLGLGFARKKIA